MTGDGRRSWTPPGVDPSGHARDSLGRGASLGEVAATVAADKAVQREREARWSYLQGASTATRTALDDLVKQQGWTSAAAWVAREPEQFGALRGKVGFFAGAKTRAERDAAQRAGGAIRPSLERIGAAEARAERATAPAWRRSARRTLPASRACPPRPRWRSAPSLW